MTLSRDHPLAPNGGFDILTESSKSAIMVSYVEKRT